MAWIFSLSAECGAVENNAHKFATHFERTSFLLSNGCQCQCHTDIFQDIEENWWCRVSPSNLSEVGIDSPESAYLMTELGILLYQSLRFATNFRYALVGVEVDEFRTYSELIEESSKLSISGLVLAKAIQNDLGVLSMFQPFSPNYVWQPYAGEVYNPLMSSPNLKNKLNELLAVS
ncbi:MAG: hypothetical protein NW214_12450 [Pseudanabaenaceae cyanobacterium bins.39]|nr:hypothetical protein [Pseudanabaenaceae cyanobacterium bins.39]